MKTKDELNKIKEEVETLNKKLHKLTDEELGQVFGGNDNLSTYIKRLAGEDKNKMLVDYGTGVKLDLNPSISHDESGNLIIIKREKNSAEK